MIINVGTRTDVVNHYGEWLFRRFREGFAYSRNPLFPKYVTRYELVPEKTDAVLFCSKNYAPVLPRLHEITSRFHTCFQYTVTGYGKNLEPNIPDCEESVKTLIALEKQVGRQRISWRYDPVLLTKRYTAEWHFETFGRLASLLAPHVDRCIFSFVETYSTLRENIPDAFPIVGETKKRLAEGLGRIAKKYGLILQTCGDDADYTQYGILNAGCSTLDIIGKANGIQFREIKHTGIRRGCKCIASRDLGWYDSCPNLCKYCYANKSAELVAENRKKHDPDSPLLIGRPEADDELREATQESYLKFEGRQMSLFD